ncbi:hypothetical protein AAVH_13764 [Aphelenchoides avenae]|nr:hypothetical protein AAVH_13764 [Aphelenchus avenae]
MAFWYPRHFPDVPLPLDDPELVPQDDDKLPLEELEEELLKKNEEETPEPAETTAADATPSMENQPAPPAPPPLARVSRIRPRMTTDGGSTPRGTGGWGDDRARRNLIEEMFADETPSEGGGAATSSAASMELSSGSGALPSSEEDPGESSGDNMDSNGAA